MKAYELIYNSLEGSILKGQYAADEFLPSENQLVKQFHVSRDTIRKALNKLMANGYIQKIQGKGSLVLKRDQLRFPVSGLTSYKELQLSAGYQSQTRVVRLKKIRIDADLAKRTGFMLDDEVIVLTRIRQIDNSNIIIDHDLLLTSVVPYLDTEIAEDSIYNYFETKLGLTISFAEKEITVEPLTAEDHQYLDLNEQDNNIVVIRSRVFLANAQQFQYTESRHRADKFKFYDFARRNAAVY
jgi:GntR family trehalose operon transcriptional repressor